MIRAYRLLIDMMDRNERRRFWLLVVLTLAFSVMEAASLSTILPFLQLLSDPGLAETNPILNRIFTALGFEDVQTFLIWLGAAVFAVTVLGLVVKTAAVWLTTHFALMRSYSFSARLLRGYLHQPYEWFLSRHSSNLGSAILGEVDRVVSEALLPAMRIIPETFTVALLVGILCLLEPQAAIGGAVLFGGAYGLIFFSVRKALVRFGRIRHRMNQDRFHVVQEAMGGIKELKVMGLERGFLDRFRTAAYQMARVLTTTQVIMVLPRYALEALAFGGMILLILVLMIRGDGDVTALIPTLGLIAVIGLRLIPALQQIYQRGTELRAALAAVERIHSDLTTLDSQPDESISRRMNLPGMPLVRSLELDGICYSYPTSSRPALHEVSLSIEANSTVGIVGGTGAGKTTLVDIILGLLDPASGTMKVDGVELTEENRRAWQKTLGYVPQTIFLSDGSIAENIAYGVPKDEIDMQAVERAARIAALHDFIIGETPRGYDTKVGERGVRLSGGQRQRVGIARALYRDPAMLILDEATSALDTLTEAAVMEAVQNIARQKTIMMIAHRLTTVRDCDRIFLLRNGRVTAAGTFEELVESDSEFRQMAAGLN